MTGAGEGCGGFPHPPQRTVPYRGNTEPSTTLPTSVQIDAGDDVINYSVSSERAGTHYPAPPDISRSRKLWEKGALGARMPSRAEVERTSTGRPS